MATTFGRLSAATATGESSTAMRSLGVWRLKGWLTGFGTVNVMNCDGVRVLNVGSFITCVDKKMEMQESEFIKLF